MARTAESEGITGLKELSQRLSKEQKQQFGKMTKALEESGGADKVVNIERGLRSEQTKQIIGTNKFLNGMYGELENLTGEQPKTIKEFADMNRKLRQMQRTLSFDPSISAEQKKLMMEQIDMSKKALLSSRQFSESFGTTMKNAFEKGTSGMGIGISMALGNSPLGLALGKLSSNFGSSLIERRRNRKNEEKTERESIVEGFVEGAKKSTPESKKVKPVKGSSQKETVSKAITAPAKDKAKEREPKIDVNSLVKAQDSTTKIIRVVNMNSAKIAGGVTKLVNAFTNPTSLSRREKKTATTTKVSKVGKLQKAGGMGKMFAMMGLTALGGLVSSMVSSATSFITSIIKTFGTILSFAGKFGKYALRFAGIFGLIAGAARLIYNNWDTIKEWTSKAVDIVTEWASGIGDMVGQFADSVGEWTSAAFDSMKNWASGIGEWASKFWDQLTNGDMVSSIVDSTISFYKNLYSTLWDYIKDLIPGLGDIADKISEKVSGLFESNTAEAAVPTKPKMNQKAEALQASTVAAKKAEQEQLAQSMCQCASENGGASIVQQTNLAQSGTTVIAPAIDPANRESTYRSQTQRTKSL